MVGDRNVPGTLNRYAYALGDLTRFTDPSGHNHQDPDTQLLDQYAATLYLTIEAYRRGNKSKYEVFLDVLPYWLSLRDSFEAAGYGPIRGGEAVDPAHYLSLYANAREPGSVDQSSAVRALDKHGSGQRPTNLGLWPAPKGNQAAKNNLARNAVDGVLFDPYTTFNVVYNPASGYDYMIYVNGANGRLIAFNSNGRMSLKESAPGGF